MGMWCSGGAGNVFLLVPQVCSDCESSSSVHTCLYIHYPSIKNKTQMKNNIKSSVMRQINIMPLKPTQDVFVIFLQKVTSLSFSMRKDLIDPTRGHPSNWPIHSTISVL